jgi:hypothetical protein
LEESAGEPPTCFFSFPLIKAENKTTPNPEYKRGRSRTKTKREKRGRRRYNNNNS